ncbi:hypothetical protein PNOK_0542200 [Pyrrhoderma noxium]|uniref:Uncharacterized protein n=1 Tax=Pyrrhoderma noxium TaxID=2282107 RepID=A0A286UG53_9AGAM|nr:hypothetical protein PNOK_0542200 [Pyrrhoderma noxium]
MQYNKRIIPNATPSARRPVLSKLVSRRDRVLSIPSKYSGASVPVFQYANAGNRPSYDDYAKLMTKGNILSVSSVCRIMIPSIT